LISLNGSQPNKMNNPPQKLTHHPPSPKKKLNEGLKASIQCGPQKKKKSENAKPGNGKKKNHPFASEEVSRRKKNQPLKHLVGRTQSRRPVWNGGPHNRGDFGERGRVSPPLGSKKKAE